MKKWFRKLQQFNFIIPILFIILGTIAVILYGRGYRPDIKNSQLISTGLIAATSDPTGAQVYINDLLKTATNNSLNIDPGWYKVKIAREGFITWEKKLRVQGEIVTRADAFLFPQNPSLSPITNTGVINPILSPDGIKIAYVIPAGIEGQPANKAGLWLYNLGDRPFGISRDTIQLGISEPVFDFTQTSLTWSPDSTQIMADNNQQVRLYQTDKSGVWEDTSASYVFIQREWDKQRQLRQRQQLAAFKQGIVDVATLSAQIIAFSPDETKILYEATASATVPQVINPALIGTNSTEETRIIEPGKIYVYDSKEDRNYFLLDKKEIVGSSPKPSPKNLPANLVPTANYELTNLFWFPTSRHLVLTLPARLPSPDGKTTGGQGKIDIMEYDRTNWVTVYSGPFEPGFMAIWPNASRIIVLSNLNPGVSTLPNLYTVNLR